MSRTDQIVCKIVSEAINAAALQPSIDPSNGAVASFLGSVRISSGEPQREGRVVALEYEAYASMAEKVMREIAQEATALGASAVQIHHRVGRLMPGEIAVAIFVASPHRAEAFEACRHVIEELKRRVPIWKREIFKDGSDWVSPTP